MAQLGDLVRYARTVDERTFVQRYPAPSLVLLAPISARDRDPTGESKTTKKVKLSDLDSGTMKIKTDTIANFTKKMLNAETQEGEVPERIFEFAPECEVYWIKKSDRNPFEGMITVGRASNNDIWIPHTSVSKLHASFALQKDVWTITDHNSSNGTLVESMPLVAGGKAQLRDGMRVDFGTDVAGQFFLPPGLYNCVRHGPPSRL